MNRRQATYIQALIFALWAAFVIAALTRSKTGCLVVVVIHSTSSKDSSC